MSESSCNSLSEINSFLTCHCGETARCFISRTELNPGRKFYKCPKPKGESCAFWLWDDKSLDKALIQINSLKAKLEVAAAKVENITELLNAVKMERDTLNKKVNDLEAINYSQANKSRILEDKVMKMKMLLTVCFASFAGFVVAKFK